MFEPLDPHDPCYHLLVDPSREGRAYARENYAHLIPELKAKLDEDDRTLKAHRLRYWLTAAQLLDQYDPDHDNANRVQVVLDAYDRDQAIRDQAILDASDQDQSILDACDRDRVYWLEAWSRAMKALNMEQATDLLTRYGGYDFFASELLAQDYSKFVQLLGQAVATWRTATGGKRKKSKVGRRKITAEELDILAVNCFKEHPDWTLRQIANEIGCSVETLKKPDRCPEFRANWNVIQEAKEDYRQQQKGGYQDRQGNIEAWPDGKNRHRKRRQKR